MLQSITANNNYDDVLRVLKISDVPFSKQIHGLEMFLGKKIPIWKRILDIAGSAMGLAVLSPLFLITSIMIKVVSRGPVFFRQDRVGYTGRSFTLWKFRTMEVDNDTSSHRQYLAELINGSTCDDESSDMPMIKRDNNSRIIPFGKILRNMSIDELPQLINVFLGEMSLVGPRPPIPYEAEEYFLWHKRRFDIVPGMTGLWQVSGKNRLTFKEMVRLDIRYSNQISFWFDIKILMLTPFAVISQIKDSLGKRFIANPKMREEIINLRGGIA